MPLRPLLLLLVAAALHTVWNLLLKKQKDRVPVFWWSLLLGSLAFLPLVALGPRLTVGIAPFVAGSALFEALYFALLSSAYAKADFSLVYPLARGSVPALLALCSVWFLGERLSWAGAGGIGLVIAGLLLLAARPRGGSEERARSAAGIGLALLTALTIVGYSLIDAAAVRRVPAISYTIVVFGSSAALLTPFLVRRYGWRGLFASLEASRGTIALIAALQLLSYTLVLRVYAVAPVAYAGAIREISIVFAALAGALWLDEGLGARRAVGATLAFAGIVVLAFSS